MPTTQQQKVICDDIRQACRKQTTQSGLLRQLDRLAAKHVLQFVAEEGVPAKYGFFSSGGPGGDIAQCEPYHPDGEGYIVQWYARPSGRGWRVSDIFEAVDTRTAFSS